MDFFSDNLMQGATGALIVGIIFFFLGRFFAKKDKKKELAERVAKLETSLQDTEQIRKALIEQFKTEIDRLDAEIEDVRNDLKHSIDAVNTTFKEFKGEIVLEFDKLGYKLLGQFEKLGEKMAVEFNYCPNHDRKS